jgi:translocation and assembly module TamB
VHSGPGSVTGQGEVVFDHLKLDRYQLDIVGKNLQVFDFPELHILCDPDLSLSGTTDQLSVQGSLQIPVLTIKGRQTSPGLLPSKDVVVDDKEEKQRKELNFATDIQVKVILGEDVTIDSGGVVTRLTGGGVVTIESTGEAFAYGEIHLVSGTFRAYGVNLKIRQGVLSYKGGAITNPGLRFFAAREVGEVLAGVQVTGSAEAPVITLYSQPAMPDRDILGYMLMGRALNSDKAESDILAMSTGSLMTGNEELFSQLGITSIDIQGLFDGSGGVRLRRKIAEKWEVESTLGIESGIDLYYIIKFK